LGVHGRLRQIARVAAAIFFAMTGIMHFLHPATYAKIVPPFIPRPVTMVYVSGAAEIAGGIGILWRPVRRAAAWGLVALLLAVFPANIYMALDRVQVTANPLPAWVLWARMPLQAAFIWWILWCTEGSGRAIARGFRRPGK
jgi:uncharacterized membrane protein